MRAALAFSMVSTKFRPLCQDKYIHTALALNALRVGFNDFIMLIILSINWIKDLTTAGYMYINIMTLM
ncbi:MAG: hypothetical protein SCM96_15425, partial [Acidobacteriota bacterium]|nr:hypothetical protein [Acidobacteriota bacterium]